MKWKKNKNKNKKTSKIPYCRNSSKIQKSILIFNFSTLAQKTDKYKSIYFPITSMYECLYIVTISIIRSRNIIFEPHVKGRMKPIILHWIHQLFKLCEVYKAFCYYKSTTMSLQSIQEDLSVREDILCWQAPNVIFFTIVKFIRLSICEAGVNLKETVLIKPYFFLLSWVS
jgi:hypothetical protein